MDSWNTSDQDKWEPEHFTEDSTIFYNQRYESVASCTILPPTDRGKSTVAFPHRRAASNESDDEQQGSDDDDDHRWDQRVHVFKKVIVVIKRNEDVGSDITQDTSGCLRDKSEAQRHFNISWCCNRIPQKPSALESFPV